MPPPEDLEGVGGSVESGFKYAQKSKCAYAWLYCIRAETMLIRPEIEGSVCFIFTGLHEQGLYRVVGVNSKVTNLLKCALGKKFMLVCFCYCVCVCACMHVCVRVHFCVCVCLTDWCVCVFDWLVCVCVWLTGVCVTDSCVCVFDWLVCVCVCVHVSLGLITARQSWYDLK